MRHSTVWVYQQFAREIGEVREKEYLTRIRVWQRPVRRCRSLRLDGALRISAMEQVDPAKLYRNELPFKVEHQRLVKDIMIVEAGRDWILRAKDRMAGVSNRRSAGGSAGRDADRGGHLRAEHRSAGRHEGCAETEAIVRSILQSDRSTSALKHARAFSWCISPCKPFPPLRNWMRSSRS